MSAIPKILDAMVDRWTESLAETDWNVTYGWDETLELGRYLMISVDDPFDAEKSEAATSSSDFATATREGITETGYVTCVAYAWGDVQREVSAAVFEALELIEADIHLHPDLGIARSPYFMVNALNIESATLHHGLDSDGARALLTIRIQFEAYRRADLS